MSDVAPVVEDFAFVQSPVDLSALLVRLAVAIGLASSAHSPSDPLAVITSFSLISEF